MTALVVSRRGQRADRRGGHRRTGEAGPLQVPHEGRVPRRSRARRPASCRSSSCGARTGKGGTARSTSSMASGCHTRCATNARELRSLRALLTSARARRRRRRSPRRRCAAGCPCSHGVSPLTSTDQVTPSGRRSTMAWVFSIVPVCPHAPSHEHDQPEAVPPVRPCRRRDGGAGWRISSIIGRRQRVPARLRRVERVDDRHDVGRCGDPRAGGAEDLHVVAPGPGRVDDLGLGSASNVPAIRMPVIPSGCQQAILHDGLVGAVRRPARRAGRAGSS